MFDMPGAENKLLICEPVFPMFGAAVLINPSPVVEAAGAVGMVAGACMICLVPFH
jgi:hypothetical protein